MTVWAPTINRLVSYDLNILCESLKNEYPWNIEFACLLSTLPFSHLRCSPLLISCCTILSDNPWFWNVNFTYKGTGSGRTLWCVERLSCFWLKYVVSIVKTNSLLSILLSIEVSHILLAVDCQKNEICKKRSQRKKTNSLKIFTSNDLSWRERERINMLIVMHSSWCPNLKSPLCE